MAKHAHNRLTARHVATAKPGKHRDGGGLFLLVSKSGTGKWVFRFAIGDKRTDLGLGSARDVSLFDARRAAAACREKIARGENPKLDHRKESVPTFGEAADAYIQSHSAAWRNLKHQKQWEMTLREYAGSIRSKPVDQIGVNDVLAVLQPIWREKPETASRLRGRVESVLDAARAKGHRHGENPARWRGHLDALLPSRQRLSTGHLKALAYEDVPAFVADLRARAEMAARALEFVILTAARSGEALGARWNEIDLNAKVWEVPAQRMKSGKLHRVALSSRVLTLLEELRPLASENTDFVFQGTRKKPLGGAAMSLLLRRMGVGATVHGFRSSFRDWCGDCTSFSRDVAEAALAHAVGDAVERAYRRGDALLKRAQLMEAWSQFVDEPHRGNVVPMTRTG